MRSSANTIQNFDSAQKAFDWIQKEVETSKERRVEVKFKVNGVALAILCPSKVGVEQSNVRPPDYLSELVEDRKYVDVKVRCLENSATCLQLGHELAHKMIELDLFTSYTLERGVVKQGGTRIMNEMNGMKVEDGMLSLDWSEGFVPDQLSYFF